MRAILFTAALGFITCRHVASAQPVESAPRIDCDFPGGNIIVDRIEGDDVHLRQDLRDSKGWWFYWYCRVRGAQNRTLRFHFKDRAIGLLGPAVSRDGGRSWSWLRQRESATAFKFAFSAEETDVRFSFAMPYQHADLARFLESYRGNPHLKSEVFASTRKGTPVEWWRLGRLDGPPAFKVWITCRHHACEMMASYVLEGLIAEVLAESTAGKWLRATTEFLIVPIVDKDGVEAGDQGKNRQPRDHAADYVGPSIYPEIAALRTRVSQWAEGQPDVALDLHNPSINHQVIYTHALRADSGENPWNNARAESQSQARRFLERLEQVQRGPLPFRVQDSLDFAAQKAKEDAAKIKSGGQNGDMPTPAAPPTRPAAFRCTFEVPYALARGIEVNAESARAFGRDLATALSSYLQNLSPHSFPP